MQQGSTGPTVLQLAVLQLSARSDPCLAVHPLQVTDFKHGSVHRVVVVRQVLQSDSNLAGPEAQTFSIAVVVNAALS